MTPSPAEGAPWHHLILIPGLGHQASQLVQDLYDPDDDVRWAANKTLFDRVDSPEGWDYQHVHHALPVLLHLLQDASIQEPEEWAGLLCRLARTDVVEHPSIQPVRDVLLEQVPALGALLLNHHDSLTRILLACTLAALPEQAPRVTELLLRAIGSEQDVDQVGELWCALCQLVYHVEKQHLTLPDVLHQHIGQLPVLSEAGTVAEHMQILLQVFHQQPTDLHQVNLLADSYDQVYETLNENAHEGSQEVTSLLLHTRPRLWEQFYQARFTHEDEAIRGSAAGQVPWELHRHAEHTSWFLDQLLGLLLDPSEYVRQEALEVLQDWENLPDITPELRTIWSYNDTYSSLRALQLLARFKDPLVPQAALAMIESGVERQIYEACEVLLLYNQQVPEVIPALQRVLDLPQDTWQKFKDRHGLRSLLQQVLRRVGSL